MFSETGRWFERRCYDENGAVVFAEAVPEGEAVDVAALAASARSQLEIEAPVPLGAPPLDRFNIVQLKSFLWLDPGWWVTYSATASAGRVSATAYASPVVAVWSMGDGTAPVVCEGPGVVFERGMDDGDTDCGHTYRVSSAGQPGNRFAVGVSVEFEVRWDSVNAAGAGGTLAPVERETVVAVEVGEIQALTD